MDSSFLEANAGRFGLSTQQAIERSYDRLSISAKIAGFSLGPLLPIGVKFFDPNGNLFKTVKPEDLITLKGLF